MIRNIIFDMGNVLIYYDPDAFLDRINLKDPEDRALLKREIYLSTPAGKHTPAGQRMGKADPSGCRNGRTCPGAET